MRHFICHGTAGLALLAFACSVSSALFVSSSSKALFWHYPHDSNQGGAPDGAIRDGD
jgi:hypothetical protein